ncbi:MAG: hypothetical protein WKG00_38600 [Polyangiaceae bacterium]
MSFARGQGRFLRALALSSAAVGVLALAIGSGACNGDPETDGASTTASDAGADVYIVQDGGGEPATPPDGEEACPAGACNYQSNEGCTAGQSCLPVLNGAAVQPACVPAGAGQSGATCAEHAECADGYLCIETRCRKLCCGGDWSACPSADEHCITTLSLGDGSGNAIDTGAMVCQPVDGCDPLTPATCATNGETCQIIDPTGASTCLPDGSGGDGDPCPCQGGFLCANLGGDASVCRRLCKYVEGGGEPFCDPGEACVHYADKHPAGVGECVPFE